MKKGLFVLGILCFLAAGAVPVDADENFRCGSHLVLLGATKGEVMLKCGQPMMMERAGSTVSGAYSGQTTDRGRGQYYTEGTYDESQVVVELWYYNCGEGQFNRTLVFEGGILRGIRTSKERGIGLADWERAR